MEKRNNNTRAGGGGGGAAAAASVIANNDNSIKATNTLQSWSEHTNHNALSDFKHRQYWMYLPIKPCWHADAGKLFLVP